MQVVRFLTEDGTVTHGQLVGPRQAKPLIGDLFGSCEVGQKPMRVVKHLAPVDPPNVFGIGRNYAAHVQETGADRPERPLVFLLPTTAVAPPEGAVILPAPAPEHVDFEAELAVVIGRTARQVSVEQALEYVFGYTCANDVTARDCQQNDGQWARAKGFDTFCPLGPLIVTTDELDHADLRIQCRLNGETMQDASTQAMLFSVPELVSHLSHQFTLQPGTVILTGTPAGVGFVRQPPRYLRDGDQVEVEIEGIGVLRNNVFAERLTPKAV
jgi:2-keto-4-pentenoate hydratase/2-oxohepta-3-ene-1,7-dioic acid hydratase in catechol pathway